MDKTTYGLMYVLVGLCAAFFVYKAHAQNGPISKIVFRTILFGACAVFAYAITLFTNNVFIMSLFHNIVFGLIDILLILLIKYATMITTNHPLKKKYSQILTVIATIDIILLLSNTLYHNVVGFQQIVINSEIYFVYQPQLLYYGHLGFCYLMVAYFAYILIKKCMAIPFIYCGRYMSLLVTFLFMIIINGIFLLGIIKVHIDISIMTYGIISIVLYHYTFKYSPKKMITKSRYMVIDRMKSPVLLFNYEKELVDYNSAANDYFNIKEYQYNRLTKEAFDCVILNCEKELIPDNVFSTEIYYNDTTYFSIECSSIFDSKHRLIGYLYMLHNINEQKLMYKTLEQLNSCDVLTGLFNKYTFYNLIQTLELSQLSPLSIVIFNINGLKLINDIFTHSKGDELIAYIANELVSFYHNDEIKARLDGDELILLLPNSNEQANLDKVNTFINHIENKNDFEFNVSVEFGIATSLSNDEAIDSIIHRARNNMIRKKFLNSKSVRSAIVESLRQSLTQSSYETEEHCERCRELASKFGTKLNLSNIEVNDLCLLAILHDIGKLAIPDTILNKPSDLTKEEFDIIKLHTIKGSKIAESSKELAPIANFILHHHEKWDGTGYPANLRGKEIPLLSRIISIIDAYDVMTNDRPYHKAISKEQAIAELQRCAGTQFDPNLVATFIEILNEK